MAVLPEDPDKQYITINHEEKKIVTTKARLMRRNRDKHYTHLKKKQKENKNKRERLFLYNEIIQSLLKKLKMHSFHASGWGDCSTSYFHQTQMISCEIQSMVAGGICSQTSLFSLGSW